MLSETTEGSEYLAIGSAPLGDNLIAESNEASTSIDIWGHGEMGITHWELGKW